MNKKSRQLNNKSEVVNILKTFITKMPDRVGEFLAAANIIAKNGGSVKRISYNKAVDAHTIFIDVSGEEETIQKIEKTLYFKGYLSNNKRGKVILVSVNINENIINVLEIIEKYKINISYINANEYNENALKLKLGILIDDTFDTVGFLNELCSVSDIKILKNDITEKNLDNTVFYISFAHDMRKILSLNQTDTNAITINANKIMQRLEGEGENPLETFKYIKKVAIFIRDHKGKNFIPKVFTKKINENTTLYLIEPPCGSNTFIIEAGNKLLFVDCGFACFEEEMGKIFCELFADFDSRKKSLFLTHCDIDHAGLCHLFDEIFVSEKTYENFLLEKNGERNFREQCKHHEAYHAITKIISKYKTPETDNMFVTEKIKFSDIELKIIQGSGGHVPGESLLIWEDEKTVFCGDVFVNAVGYSKEQAEFNSYAPYLTTSVNVDSKKALSYRNGFMKDFKGYFVCPGHGKWSILQ